MRGRPHRHGGGVPLAALAIVAFAWSSPGQAQDLEELSRELTDIEGELEGVKRQPLRAQSVRSPTYVEERLTDGELFYRLQDYLRASIIFTDIVENHPRHPAAADALFLLGDSLFHAGDYLGARSRFRQVLDRAGDPAMRPYVQRALGRLIEIAIHIRDFDGVEQYFQQLSRLPPTEVEATTAYFRAKYLYSRAVPQEDVLRESGTGNPEEQQQAAFAPSAQVDLATLEQARVAFEAVPAGSPYYLQARYFIGVVHTIRNEYPQAIEAFRRVLRGEATTPEQRLVLHLTHLALGRLHYETDQLDQAIEAYQAVPRTSPFFDTALYEIAWVYIRLGDSTRAERALEVLSVAAPDSHYIPDGKVLRGNLLLRNGRFDDANDVFREVRNQFGPVLRDLDEMREANPDLQAYFRQLVRENMEAFDVSNFIPERAQGWVNLEGDFERAIGALRDLAQARQLIRETDDLVVRLNAALGAPNRVSVFTDLRMQRETTTALRNRAADVRRQLVRWEERNVRSGGGELESVREQRRRIERQLGGMPTSEDDFMMRDDELLGRYRALERQLSELQVELLGIDARIVALNRFLETAEGLENPEAIRTEIAQHEAAVVGYRQQIEQLERLIEVGRIQVGVGDTRYQRDTRLRDEYRALVERERQLTGASGSEAEPLFRRLASIEAGLDQHDARIDAVVEERVGEMRRVINEEEAKLAGYRDAIAGLEGEAEEVIGAVTADTFEDVRGRFYDLVLRADVGRIDVSWARREEHRMRVDMLTRERSRELQALDDEFRDIMDDGQGQEDEL